MLIHVGVCSKDEPDDADMEQHMAIETPDLALRLYIVARVCGSSLQHQTKPENEGEGAGWRPCEGL